MWNTNVYRKLCLIISWLGFSHLIHYKVSFLKAFRKKGGNAFDMLKDLRLDMAKSGVLESKRLKLLDPKDT
jgi:hypothetical protein